MPNKIFKLFFAFITLSLLAQKGVCNQTTDYNQGLQSFQQGDLLNAEKLLKGVKENFPHAKYLLGLIQEKKGTYREALIYFDDFIKNLDSNDDLYFAVKAHQAYCYSFLEDEENAKQILNEIISKKIIDKNINLIIGSAELHLGADTRKDEYANEAISAYTSVLKNSDSNDPEALNGLGRSYLLLFDISKHNKTAQKNYLNPALTYICQAIQIKPTAIYYNNLGAIYYKMDDWKSAENSFSIALKIAGSDQTLLDKFQKNLTHIKEMEKRNPLPRITPTNCDALNQTK